MSIGSGHQNVPKPDQRKHNGPHSPTTKFNQGCGQKSLNLIACIGTQSCILYIPTNSQQVKLPTNANKEAPCPSRLTKRTDFLCQLWAPTFHQFTSLHIQRNHNTYIAVNQQHRSTAQHCLYITTYLLPSRSLTQGHKNSIKMNMDTRYHISTTYKLQL